MMVARLALALASGFAAALAFYPALALPRGRRRLLLLLVAVPILLSPLLLPPEAALLRFVVSVNAVALVVKLYDLHRDAERGPRPSFRNFAVLLPNWGSYVLRKLDGEPQPGRRQNLVHLLWGLVGLAATSALMAGIFRINWYGQPFYLEHCAKVSGYCLAVVPATTVMVALWRLAGEKARDFTDNPYFSPTPADFWRRYNRPAQQFFYEDIFKPAGGWRAPVRATLVTFALSALMHEYAFGIAIGRVQGYQTAYFLLQGCAVAATVRLNPRGWYAFPWILATIAFNLAAAVFFFASVNGLLPFYSQGLPGWLAGW